MNSSMSKTSTTGAESEQFSKDILKKQMPEFYGDNITDKSQKNMNIQVVSPDVQHVLDSMQKLFVTGPNAILSAAERSAGVAAIYALGREKVIGVLNAGTNTISAERSAAVIAMSAVMAGVIMPAGSG